MRTLNLLLLSWWFAVASATSAAGAQFDGDAALETPVYEVFDTDMGSPGLIGQHEVLVMPEPAPATVIEQAPPLEPPQAFVAGPGQPYEGAIWVDGHWTYGGTEFVWVDGHYIAPLTGFVFVGPRWVFSAGRYYYFEGYYRPCGAYVQTYFNPFYFYRPYPYAQYFAPPRYYRYAYRPVYGPYWPVGAPRPGQATASGRLLPPSNSWRPVGAPTSPSRGGTWPSAFPSSVRTPSLARPPGGAARGFTPSRGMGAGRGGR